MLNTASLLRVVAVWLLNENQRHGNVRFGLPCNWKHVSGETGRYRAPRDDGGYVLGFNLRFRLVWTCFNPRLGAAWPGSWQSSLCEHRRNFFFGRIETERRSVRERSTGKQKTEAFHRVKQLLSNLSLYSEEHDRFCRVSKILKIQIPSGKIERHQIHYDFEDCSLLFTRTSSTLLYDFFPVILLNFECESSVFKLVHFLRLNGSLCDQIIMI